jgi:O-antigen/teichoic acid export membrane protein
MSGAGITLIGQVVGSGVNYFSRLIVAGLLGAGAFGLYSIGLAVFNGGTLLSQLGLNVSLLRFIPTYQVEGELGRIKGTIWLSVAGVFFVGLLFSGGLLLAAPLLARQVFGEPQLSVLFRLFGLAIPFMSAMTVGAFAARGLKDVRPYVYAKNLCQPVGYLTLVVVLYGLGFGLVGFVWAWLVSCVLAFLLTLQLLRRLMRPMRDIRPQLPSWGILHSSLPLTSLSLYSFVMLWTDTLLLGYLASAKDVGIYSVSAQLVLLLTVVVTALNSIYPPLASEMFQQNRTVELAESFRMVSRWMLFASLPIFLFLVLAGRDALQLVGGTFSAGYLALVILAVGQAFHFSTGPVGYVLAVTAHQTALSVIFLCACTLNVILNIFLIPILGVNGAALATAISLGAANISMLLHVWRKLGLNPYDIGHLKSVVAGLATVAAVLSLDAGMSFDGPFRGLLLRTSVIGIVFMGITLLLGLDEGDRQLFAMIRERIIAAAVRRK